MTFIDITCMSDRSEEVIIETFPRRNDTPFFTTRSCRLVHCVHATHNGSQWWNAGMGNTDTLHPNSCFCSFSIPTSENKNFVTSLYCFYAHAHETTPTSGYKLSHTHIVVEEEP